MISQLVTDWERVGNQEGRYSAATGIHLATIKQK